MITFCTGKPGDGKSMYATALILKALVDGECYVVTNVPLKPSEIAVQVALQRKAKNDARIFSFDDSARVLKDEEVYEFYRRRSGGLVLCASPDFECEPRDRLDRPEFVAGMKKEFMRIRENPEWMLPVHYFIDEAHNFFSAREWASAGRGMLYYASQHRHLHDQIFFITQVVDNVEKQLRGLASETHRIRNQMRRNMGPFRLRPCFKIHQFYGVPSDTSPCQPYDVTTMFLDPAGVASCYHTVGALGVQTKPEKNINKGLFPWWSIWVLGAGVCVALFAAFAVIPAWGGRAVAKALTNPALEQAIKQKTGLPQTPVSIDNASHSLNNNSAAVVPREKSPSEPVSPVRQAKPVQSQLEWATGWVVLNGRINVTLADGRTITEEGGLAKVERNRVIMEDGTIYWRGTPSRQRDSSPLPSTVRGPNGKETGSVKVLPGEPASPQGVPATPTVFPSTASVSGSGSWVTDSDGVSHLRVSEHLNR